MRFLARFGGESVAEEWYQSVQGIGCEDGRTGEGGSEDSSTIHLPSTRVDQ